MQCLLFLKVNFSKQENRSKFSFYGQIYDYIFFGTFSFYLLSGLKVIQVFRLNECCFYSGYHKHALLKGFYLRVQTCVLVDINQPLPWFFMCWPRADSFTISRALGSTYLRLSHFCNILLQDLAQSHVKISRSTNLLSVCRRKLKLSTCAHCKLQTHKLSHCSLGTRLSSC